MADVVAKGNSVALAIIVGLCKVLGAASSKVEI